MGITGLIPFLDRASTRCNIKDLKGKTVAVDTYCWLHKGAFACADKLARSEETDIHIRYCLKYVNLFLSNDIKPILVFDGRHLPAKADTEAKRRESRKESKQRAVELLRLGKSKEAFSYLRRCVDITHEMALNLIQECRKMNVDCIVAPYEADAQLAYLNKIKLADYIVTEDSDLVLFGCSDILFKLDQTGNCLLVEASKIPLAMNCNQEKYTFDKFRRMCILSGCDYLPSLPGIGLAKSCKFILMTEETNMEKALLKLPSYLNMPNLVVSEEYIENFLKAEATFKHMYVFDPLIRKMVRLNELETYGTDAELCSNAGTTVDEETAFQLALGNLNPFTFKKLDDWHPDHCSIAKKNTGSYKEKGNSLAKHKSIWHANYQPHGIKTKSKDIRCALSFKKVNYKLQAEYNDEHEELKCENEIVSLYSGENPPQKRRCLRSFVDEKNTSSSTENYDPNNLVPLTPTKNSHNPFAKKSVDNSNRIEASVTTESNNMNSSFLKIVSPVRKSASIDETLSQKRISKFERTEIKQTKTVMSRFFQTKNSPRKQNIADKSPSEKSDLGSVVQEVKSSQEKQLSESAALYLSSPETLECKKRCKTISSNLSQTSTSKQLAGSESQTNITDAIDNCYGLQLSASKERLESTEIDLSSPEIKCHENDYKTPQKISQPKLDTENNLEIAQTPIKRNLIGEFLDIFKCSPSKQSHSSTESQQSSPKLNGTIIISDDEMSKSFSLLKTAVPSNKKTITTGRRLGLSRSNKGKFRDQGQSKLSMFGFQKKPMLRSKD